MKNKRKSKAGRKCNYESKVKPNLLLIEDWRNKGCSEELIAKKLGVGFSTLSEYKNKYPELSEVLRKSKKILGAKIKKQLYKECLGYEKEEICEEAKIEPVIDEFGNVKNVVKEIKRKKTKKWFRPQQSLIIFTLCNLLPDEFKRVDQDVIDNLGEELEKRIFSNSKIQEAFNVLYDGKNEKKELETKING